MLILLKNIKNMENKDSENIKYLISLGVLSNHTAERHINDLKIVLKELNDNDKSGLKQKEKHLQDLNISQKSKIDFLHKFIIKHKDNLNISTDPIFNI